MTDKLRQAAQQMLEAVADLTILTPREWQAVHGLKIDALRAALAEQPAEQEPVARESVDDALMIVASYGPWGADLTEANARRLVACWNLLSPFTTEQIEAGEADVVALAAQRDELLEVLKRIADPRNIHFAGDAQVVARAAIAKVEGEKT